MVGDFNGDGIQDLATANLADNTVTVLLGAVAPTTSLLSTTSPLTITVGQPVPLTLIVTDTTAGFNAPTGTATFSDGATVLGTATQSASPYTFTAASLGLGSHTLSATYAGDTRNSGSASNSITIQVNQDTQTITFGPLSNVVFGSGTVTLSATASSGLAVTFASTTTAVCTVSGNIVNLVSAGACSITATQSGNGSDAPAPPVTETFTVMQAAQTITFISLSNAALGSGPGALTATASSGLAVTFASTTTAVCTVAGNIVSLVTAGTCSIAASQPGNANYSAAPNVVQSFAVTPGTQTITFGPIGSVAFGTAPFSLTATATSNLPVSFASTTPGVCTVAGSTVSIAGAGTCSLTASQAGSANYAAAPNVIQSFSVTPATQTITFAPLGAATVGSGSISLSATASSGLPVSFSSSTPAVCAVSGNILTLVSAGICSITATQAGNNNYLLASATQGITVTGSTQGQSGTTPQTISFGGLSNVAVGATFSVGAVASSGLPVSFVSIRQASASFPETSSPPLAQVPVPLPHHRTATLRMQQLRPSRRALT